MHIRGFLSGLTVGIISTCLFAVWVSSATSKEKDAATCLPPEAIANYLYNVLQADRSFYTNAVVERMQKRGIVFASEHWKMDGELPLPAQFVLEAGRLMEKGPSGVRFRLISSWPINKNNGPTTEFERVALTKVLENTDRPYTGITMLGKTRVFQALYADKAVSQICADCHNVHPNSPKRNFKVGGVVGGMLLTIPLPN
jgi:hypothetical protein